MDQNTQETEATLERIRTHKGVIGLAVYNDNDFPITTNVNKYTTLKLAKTSRTLEELSRNGVRDLDPTDDLIALRIQTYLYEIIIAPDEASRLVVIQEKVPLDEDE